MMTKVYVATLTHMPILFQNIISYVQKMSQKNLLLKSTVFCTDCRSEENFLSVSNDISYGKKIQ